MKSDFKKIRDSLLEECEEIAGVRCPSSEYLAALKEIHGEVDAWFEASIEAAKDDVRRAEEQP